MRNLDLLSEKERPPGFEYPTQFSHTIELGLTELEPWHVLEGKRLRETMSGLAQRYPARKLIPFARRQDNDDIACWQVGAKEEVLIIHDFASPGWEERERFSSFYDWLRRAVEDLIEFYP
jgi:hypothetical protein